MTSKSEKKNRLGSVVAFILAIAPVLDPYVLITTSAVSIKLMDIPMILIVSHIIYNRKKSGAKENGLLIVLYIFTFLTLASFLIYDGSRNLAIAIKVIMFWSMYAFCIRYLWQVNDYEKFIKYAIRIAIVANILLILQFIAVELGFHNFFDGKIPFLKLGKTEGWAPLVDTNTGHTRVHSFFQEPSYFAIYCLPVLAELLKKQKLKIVYFILLGMVTTSSLVAIIGSVVITLYILLTYKKFRKKYNYKFWIRIVVASFFAFLAFMILYVKSDGLKEVLNNALARVSNIGTDLQGERMGSAKIRLVGYAKYFETYLLIFKFIGVGASQYPLYLSQYGVMAYSNTFVTILLNYGILGLCTFTAWIVRMFIKSSKENKCFVIIFIIICIVDNFWFNWYFYYILTWIIYKPIILDKK